MFEAKSEYRDTLTKPGTHGEMLDHEYVTPPGLREFRDGRPIALVVLRKVRGGADVGGGSHQEGTDTTTPRASTCGPITSTSHPAQAAVASEPHFSMR